jgi:hypothetical protein
MPVQPSANIRAGVRELLLAALFFLLVVVVSFFPIVFLGRSLVASDNFNPLAPTYSAANYGPHFIPPSEWERRGIVPHANLLDPGSAWWQGEPNLHFFRRAIFSGEFPFWDPSAAAGAPAYTNLTPSMLFAPQILLSLAGATSGQKNFYILAMFWACGWGTYWLLRLHRISIAGSVGGGLAFLFSGGIQQVAHINFMAQVVACMPFLLIATRLFLDSSSYRRTACLALVFACVALASFPPLLLASFAFSLLYFVSAVLLDAPRRRWQVVYRYIIATLLAVSMVAVYYLPSAIAVGRATHITKWYQTAGLGALQWPAIFDLLSPTAGGGDSVYFRPIMVRAESGRLFYVGVTVLLLSALSFGRAELRMRTLQVASAACIGLVLLKVFGVPPVQWIAHLPVFNTVHYALYWGIVVAFAASLLAGLGLDALVSGRVSRQAFGAAAATLIIFVAALWTYAYHTGALQRFGAWRWTADYRLLILWTAIACVAGTLPLVWRDRRKLGMLTASLVLCLIAAEGVANATYPRQRRSDVFAHPPSYIPVLQQRPPQSRGFVAAALNANLESAFGINTLDSLYTFVSTRVFALYLRYTAAPPWVFLREATVLPPEPVLDRAGISWVMARHEMQAIHNAALKRQMPAVYQDADVVIYDRPSAERFFFSSDYVMTDSATALRLISTAPAKQVILEAQPGFAPHLNEPTDPAPQLLDLRLNFIKLRLKVPRDGLLYVADTFDQGWSARVNGRSVPILLANYAFRAVPVEAGETTIELSYLPSGFRLGLAFSLSSVAATLALLFANDAQFRNGECALTG